MSWKIIWVEIIWVEIIWNAIIWVEIIWNVTEPDRPHDIKELNYLFSLVELFFYVMNIKCFFVLGKKKKLNG